MNTEFFNAATQKENGTNVCGRIIRAGGLVAFPTETVYGLGANGLDGCAVEKIFAAKGRPGDNPLILHIAKKSDLKQLWKHVPDKARQLADAFWPGPLTMVYLKSDIVPPQVTAGLSTVAVRMPEHKTALALIRAAGVPIAAPSANLSGKPSPTCAQHVLDDLDGCIDAIIDGGDCRVGVESTVLSLVGTPTVLRPGGVTREMLESVIGHVDIAHAVLNPLKNGETAASPGMKYKHYSPDANVVIVTGDSDKVVGKINELCELRRKEGKRVGVMTVSEDAGCYNADKVVDMGSRCDEALAAKNLFAALRSFDEDGIQYVYSESFPTDNVGQAVMNRLIKAAGHTIIKV